MKPNKPKISIESKYNLQGRAEAVKHSERIDERVASLQKRGASIRDNGENYSTSEKRLFGGVPPHGDPGYNHYFKIF